MEAPNCIEHFYPLDVDATDPALNSKTIGGGRLSLKDVYDKFSVRFTTTALTSQAVRHAAVYVANLYSEATSEKVYARRFSNPNDIKIWNTIIENLEYMGKALKASNISLAVEAKIATPV